MPEPVNLEAEAAVLGCLLSGSVLPSVTVDDFTEPRHRDVFAAVVALMDAAVPVDPVSVLSQLRSDGNVATSPDKSAGLWLHDLLRAAPTPSGVEFYARAVVEASVRRRVAQAFARVAQAAVEGSLDTFSAVVRDEMAAVHECGQRLGGGRP